MNLTMRKPCVKCGETEGRIETRGGQDCVFCSSCGKYAGYNAPKTETGRAPRTVTSVHNGIKPKQRARILMRATGRCELCGKRAELHVGHLISVDAGVKLGMRDDQINDDENLSALCAECNLGVSNEPIPLRLAMGMVLSRIDWKSTQEAVANAGSKPEQSPF